MTRDDTIYKLLPAALWQKAVDAGQLDGAPVDLQDGFIHFSTATQLRETADKHFAGQADLILLAVDARALGSELRWEPSRGGALFPHLYGPLPLAAVLDARPVETLQDGRHVFPETVR
ncbi:DUF952 domain-containing protein [Aureimonas frigidaquae]|uniref:DUF952 domain-containing protein n=1 Tax=Aureimonas frigidaquae TaxID=424757 RepID=UPI0007839B85|nr:DUF952 domain-containing protein [Aureimonas frigidaquae]